MKPEELGKIIPVELEKIYPEAICSLDSDGDPFRLLIMACLSAQCTDARVNIVSKELFAVCPDAECMAKTDIETLEGIVRPCGLYKTKAKHIKELALMIVNNYGGKVPDAMEDLLTLPGVGRKVANLILGDVYGKGGIVTDTHCIRICGRLGFYPEEEKNPLKVEKILTPLIEKEKQSHFCHRLVLFGREHCPARSQDCTKCPLNPYCVHYKKDKGK